MLGLGVPLVHEICYVRGRVWSLPGDLAEKEVRPGFSGTSRQAVPREKWPPGWNVGSQCDPAVHGDTHRWSTALGDVVKSNQTEGSIGKTYFSGANRSVFTMRQTQTWPRKLAMGVPHKTLKFGLISIKPLRALGVCPKLTWAWTLGTNWVCWDLQEHASPGEVLQWEPPPSIPTPGWKDPIWGLWKVVSKPFRTMWSLDFILTRHAQISAFFAGRGGWDLKNYLSVSGEVVP